MKNQRQRRLSREGLVIVLTGGIGAGKSFVLKHFAKLGFKTLSLDHVAARILNEDAAIRFELKSQFPDCIASDGTVDKKLLSEMIFSDQEKLKKLNLILHPAIRKRYEELTKNLKRSIVIEIPLMIEALLREDYIYSNDAVILVKASTKTRLKRAMLRNNMTEKKFNDIKASQLADDVKERYVDFIIQNENSLAVLNQIVKFLHGRFKRNSFRH